MCLAILRWRLKMQEVEFSSLEDLKPDIIIDARSPREFEHSHISEAVNVFALNDDEHEEVGTIYKQSSKHHAKVLGASYICKNASQHLLELEKTLKAGSKVFIYCARGGMRSGSLGTILDQVGFRVFRLKGGYKAYRREVLDFLENDIDMDFITLFGNTGCGKTKLIHALNPSIDLEGLANHQGSSFGLIHGKQPSMKAFQNELFSALKAVQKERFCFIEGESRKIGSISLPKPLYEKMQNGVSVWVESRMEFRVQRILEDYESISDEYFYSSMEKIKPYIQKSAKDEIISSYKKDDMENVAFLLLENYYDKVYKKPSRVDFTVRFNEDINSSLEKLRDILRQKLN